jgi:flavodoxin I
MPKAIVLYYSRTGNTEKMANAVAEGLCNFQGLDVDLKFYATPEELADANAIIIGMPTYHHDMTDDMKKLLEDIEAKEINLKGKIGASFGSYGWHEEAEAPNLILETMENKFDMDVLKPPLVAKYTPDEECLEECRKLGRSIAEQILKPL